MSQPDQVSPGTKYQKVGQENFLQHEAKAILTRRSTLKVNCWRKRVAQTAAAQSSHHPKDPPLPHVPFGSQIQDHALPPFIQQASEVQEGQWSITETPEQRGLKRPTGPIFVSDHVARDMGASQADPRSEIKAPRLSYGPLVPCESSTSGPMQMDSSVLHPPLLDLQLFLVQLRRECSLPWKWLLSPAGHNEYVIVELQGTGDALGSKRTTTPRTVFFLCESNLASARVQRIKTILGFSLVMVVDAVGRSVVFALFWDDVSVNFSCLCH